MNKYYSNDDYLSVIDKLLLSSCFYYEKIALNNNNVYYKIYSNISNMILIGNPHPNEPTSQIAIETFIQYLIDNNIKSDKKCSNYIYIFPIFDLENSNLNDNWWISYPNISTLKLAKLFHRQSPNLQPEWGMNLTYKGYKYVASLEESIELMNILDEVSFDYIFNFHSSLVGEKYVLCSDNISDEICSLNKKYNWLKEENNFIPFCSKYCSGVFSQPSAKLEIDYFSQFIPNYIDYYQNGSSTFEYISEQCKKVLFEIPTFKLSTLPNITSHHIINVKLKIIEDFYNNVSLEHLNDSLVLSYPKFLLLRKDIDYYESANYLNKQLQTPSQKLNMSDYEGYVIFLINYLSMYYRMNICGININYAIINLIENELKKYCSNLDFYCVEEISKFYKEFYKELFLTKEELC